MGGALISLQMSRWIAKRAMGVHLVDSGKKAWLQAFSTHPPLADRIAALELGR